MMEILIIKLSAIGDVVHTIPCLEALRKAYPDSNITWLVEEDAQDMVRDHPCLDTLVVSGRKRWMKSLRKPSLWLGTLRDIFSFIREIRRKKYDLVIDFQGLFKSGILAFLSKGKRKIGYDKTREWGYLFINDRLPPYNPDAHAVERYLNLTEHVVGVHVGEPRFSVPVDESRRKRVEKLLNSNDIGKPHPLVAVHPGSGWETKLWDWEKFSSLCDRIIDELDARVVFTGSENDRRMIDSISSGMRGDSLNTAGKMNLKELASLLGLVDLMICTDTGPMHIASAMKTPVIAVFGPTAPWRTGPYGDGHTVIRTDASCSPCFKRKCDSRKCMTDITVENVFAAAARKLSSSSSFESRHGCAAQRSGV